MSQITRDERLGPPDPVSFLLQDGGQIPNNPVLPALLLRKAVRQVQGNVPAAVLEDLFEANGWTGCWRNGIYSFCHFHSTSHEVLGVSLGHALVQLGGRSGPALQLEPGDVLVLPAGTGHENLSSSPNLVVVGAYPNGRSWDLATGKAGERPLADRNIAQVPLTSSDPVYGHGGPLSRFWQFAK